MGKDYEVGSEKKGKGMGGKEMEAGKEIAKDWEEKCRTKEDRKKHRGNGKGWKEKRWAGKGENGKEQMRDTAREQKMNNLKKIAPYTYNTRITEFKITHYTFPIKFLPPNRKK